MTITIDKPYNYSDRPEIQVDTGMPTGPQGEGHFSVRLTRFGFLIGEVQIQDTALYKALRGGTLTTEQASAEFYPQSQWVLGCSDYWGLRITFDQEAQLIWRDEGLIDERPAKKSEGEVRPRLRLTGAGVQRLVDHINDEKPGGFADWVMASNTARLHNQGRISFTAERRVP